MKKLLSLFTILCCVMTLVCIPVSVEANATAVAFSDNFETETDNVPDNWEVDSGSADTSLTVKEENGNKYLSLKATAQRWSTDLPIAVTKAGKVLLSTSETNKPILLKLKTRVYRANGGSVRHVLQLGVPDSATYNNADLTDNKYQVYSVRPTTFFAASTQDSQADTKISISENTWYDISALINPADKSIKFTIGNTDQGYLTYNSNYANSVLANLNVINNIALKLMMANDNAQMDIDDISIEYVPTSRSFSDDFESETANKAPSNWIDKKSIASLTVMEETGGNKYLRINKTTGTGVPLVSTMTGLINMPYNEENGKGIVVEAKIRQQNTDFRSLLMLSAPDSITDTDYAGNKYTPFYINTNLAPTFMPGYKATDAVSTGTWLTYRAVIVPGSEQTEIRHYINGSHKNTTYANATTMPELFNPDALENITFTWRPASGNASEATKTGYMDIDDIVVYEITDVVPTVSFTNASGNTLENIADGTVTANVSVENNGNGKTFDVYGALYTKENDNWKLTSVVSDELYTSPWRSDSATFNFNVTDSSSQMIKVFVWYDLADMDSDPGIFETSLKLQPVCAPFELSAQN